MGKNRQEIKEKMSNTQIKIKEPPKGWSPEIIDFVNKLLIKNPEERLGKKGFSEFKNHPWLSKYDWKSTYLQKEKAPFIPPKKVICSEDIESFNLSENSKNLKKIKASELYKKAFVDFKYFNKYSKTCIEKREKYINPHTIYTEEDKKFISFSDEKGKNEKIKEDKDKKIIENKLPCPIIKTKIFNNRKDENKIDEKKGILIDNKIINLDLVDINKNDNKISEQI